MYTRFKSQKAGIKHGLNQIANSTRSRVVVPPTVTVTNDGTFFYVFLFKKLLKFTYFFLKLN